MTVRGRAFAAFVASAALTAGGALLVGAPSTAAAAPAPTAAGAECVVTDATLVWGFKESFRAYISGSIARGEWEALEGATYETPVFTFTGGTGALAPDADAGEVGFPGAMRFTGHDGILDTLIANPRIVVTGAATADLVADVTGTRQEDFSEVEALGIPFVELDLAAAESVATVEGVVTLTGVPAVLTSAGADAFGTYPAGETFDAVTLTYPLAEGCDVALGEATDDAGAGGATVTTIVAVVGVLLAAAVAVGVMVFRPRGQSAP